MTVPTLHPAVVDALADSRRRVALAVLQDRAGGVPVADLAARVASREAALRTGTAAAADPDPETVRATLRHDHLPRLAEAGGVVFDSDTDRVAAAAGSPFDREWVHRLLGAHPEPEYDPVLRALASQRRQFVLHAVFAADGPLSPSTLAAEVAAREGDGDPATVPDPTRRLVEVSLVHVHLPRLDGVDFVAWDRAARAVRPGSATWRDAAWVAASPIGEWAAASYRSRPSGPNP